MSTASTARESIRFMSLDECREGPPAALRPLAFENPARPGAAPAAPVGTPCGARAIRSRPRTAALYPCPYPYPYPCPYPYPYPCPCPALYLYRRRLPLLPPLPRP